MPDLSAKLSRLPAVRGQAPWPGHEYARGWCVITWRLRQPVRVRERLASALGMGHIRLCGTMPSGHDETFIRSGCISSMTHERLLAAAHLPLPGEETGQISEISRMPDAHGHQCRHHPRHGVTLHFPA